MEKQLELFRKIKGILLPHQGLADEVSELLKISVDSAYRRIRGETSMSFDEAVLLAGHFGLQLDALAGRPEGSILFTYNSIDAEDVTMEKYLSAILDDLKKIEQFSEREIIYAAKDIPVFHHFLFPELAAFKIFFWMKSVLGCPALENKSFSSREIQRGDVQLGEEILSVYTRIPAVEIWTEETLNSTLKQVQFYWDSGYIDTEKDGLLLCDQLLGMLQHIKKQAELGYKFLKDETAVQPDGNFKLFFSEVMIGNNNILVKIGQGKVTYLTHNTLNYLITTHSGFCDETEASLKSLMKKSTLLSGISEKHRNQFFRKAFSEVEQLKRKIEQDSR